MLTGMPKRERDDKVRGIFAVLKSRMLTIPELSIIHETKNYIKYNMKGKTVRYKATERGIRHEILSIYGDKNQYKEWTRIKTMSINKWHTVLSKKGLV